MSSCSPHSGLGCWYWCWPRAPPPFCSRWLPAPPRSRATSVAPCCRELHLVLLWGGLWSLWSWSCGGGPLLLRAFRSPTPPLLGEVLSRPGRADDWTTTALPRPVLLLPLGLARPVLLATLSASSSLGLLDPVSPSVGPRWARGLGGSGWVPPGSRGPWAAAWVGSVGSVGGVCGPLVRR